MKKYAILRKAKSIKIGGRGFAAKQLAQDQGPFELSIEQISDSEVAELAADPNVECKTPIMPTRLIKPLTSDLSADGSNWGVAAIGADVSPYSGAGVTVAVLDTGIDRKHPAFSGMELVEKDFSGSGNGDNQGHGTHCAGIIFGRDIEVRIGVARSIGRALIGKVLSDEGTGQSEAIFEALMWAMREGADIISLSLGFDFSGMVSKLHEDGWPVDLATSTALEAYRSNLRMFDALMNVLQAQSAFGTSPLVVAAAGNESQREVNPKYRIAASLPAAADRVISVAAIGRSANSYMTPSFSNSFAVISAPGVDIISAWPSGGLHSLSGTSMACPHVAGVAALWWEYVQKSGSKPSSAKVASHLLASARKDVFPENVDEADVGYGLVTAP